MYHINELVQNSVLLDSTVSDDNKQSKAFNTAFMHKMYSPVIIGETPYLAKLTLEEFGNSATKDTQRRLYNVRDIKIEPAENIGFTNESLARSFSESSDMSISDLYAIVKTFDEDFYLNKLLLCELAALAQFLDLVSDSNVHVHTSRHFLKSAFLVIIIAYRWQIGNNLVGLCVQP